MNLTILTWNGHNINDGTNYNTAVIPGQRIHFRSQAVYSDRAENFPYLSGMVLPPHSFQFRIIKPSGSALTIAAARDQLAGWFSILDFTPHALIAQDTEDSNKQYQLIGFPAALDIDPSVTVDTAFVITIAVAEPVWQAVNATTNTWNITATGQTKTINTPGNTYAHAKYAITPTSARTGQFQYSRWCPVSNPISTPLSNYSLDVTNGGINTANLVNFTGVSNQINQVGGITSVATSIPVDTPVGGGLPTTGGMCYVGTEQIIYSGISAGTMTVTQRGAGGTTPATHPDNAVMSLSKMLANGADVAVQVDGQLVNLWIDGINTATTKVWIAQNWQPGQSGTLAVALPNNGTAVDVAFGSTTANKNLLTALKTAKNSVFWIGTEAFTFSPGNVDIVGNKIASCIRAQKNTSFAAHSVADVIIWIEHDIWLLYGNPAGSPLVVDNTQQPLLDLHNSTNTSWVQANFFDTASARPAAWGGAVISSAGGKSVVYTGNQTALANPSTELGMSLVNYVSANTWKAETASIAWSFYHPAGITTVSMAGSKRLISGTSWPALAGLQKSSNGNTWLTVWNEAIPVSLNAWSAFTHNAQTLSGTYTNIRLALSGSVQALASNEADIQGDTITLALDSSRTPVVSLQQENNIYYLSAKLTNTTTGDYILLSWPMALNRTITVDCGKKTVTYDDGSNAIAALTISSTRNDWLTLAPGNNVYQYDDTGIANITIVTTYNDRNL